MNIWWCNQGTYWEQEKQAGIVCSSESQNNPFRSNVGDAKAGDIIVHYRKPNIVAFSRAKENGVHHNQLPPLPGVDYGSGWRFATEYWALQNPIHRDGFRQALIPHSVKYYPIAKNGNVKQGYFFPFDETGLQILLNQVHEPIPAWLEQFIPLK